jgi:hypothetical protein
VATRLLATVHRARCVAKGASAHRSQMGRCCAAVGCGVRAGQHTRNKVLAKTVEFVHQPVTSLHITHTLAWRLMTMTLTATASSAGSAHPQGSPRSSFRDIPHPPSGASRTWHKGAACTTWCRWSLPQPHTVDQPTNSKVEVFRAAQNTSSRPLCTRSGLVE